VTRARCWVRARWVWARHRRGWSGKVVLVQPGVLVDRYQNGSMTLADTRGKSSLGDFKFEIVDL
jgi:hypothetical protein